MKLNLIAATIVLLVASLSRYECRAIESPGAADDTDPPRQQTLPLLERVGEEYFIRLANGNSDSFRPSPNTYPGGGGGGGGGSPGAFYNRAAWRLQLTRRLLEGRVGNVGALLLAERPDDSMMGRGRRAEEPPISLDLTFHLLREMMEMSRAEQMVQQAQSNRRMMEFFGKK